MSTEKTHAAEIVSQMSIDDRNTIIMVRSAESWREELSQQDSLAVADLNRVLDEIYALVFAWKRDAIQKLRLQSPKVVEFIEAIVALCKKHELSIGHEDGQGAFIIDEYADGYVAWLRAAIDDTGEGS